MSLCQTKLLSLKINPHNPKIDKIYKLETLSTFYHNHLTPKKNF